MTDQPPEPSIDPSTGLFKVTPEQIDKIAEDWGLDAATTEYLKDGIEEETHG